jgi:hypothetical protein
MNEQVANIVKVYLKDLPWVQVISGLAKTIGVKTPIGDPEAPTFITKKYPAPCTAPDVCSPDALPKILIPDVGKRSIVYFEDGGVSFVNRSGNHTNYLSRLKLVVWLNTGFFTSPRCNITPLVIADILRNLPTEPFNMGGFTRITLVVKGEDPRTNSIFAKYNYDAISNLLIPPYDYFALNLETAFSVDPDCMDAVVIQEDPCIGPNEDYRDPDCPDCPDINPNCCTLDQMPDVKSAIDDLQTQIDNISVSSGSSVLVHFVANEDVPAFQPVIAGGLLADSATVNQRDKVIGISSADVLNGFSGTAIGFGEIQNPGWSWAVGARIFLNGGNLSMVAPSSGYSQQIGKAIAADTIDVCIGHSILL